MVVNLITVLKHLFHLHFNCEKKMSYCKLYIDSTYDKNIVNSFLYDSLDKLECSYAGYVDTVDIVVFDNDNCNSSVKVGRKASPTETIYYVDIYDENEDDDLLEFKEIVIELIKLLREKFEYVVASCEFEEFVIQETGWNWTETNPYPSLN